MRQGYTCESCGRTNLHKGQTFAVEIQPITGPGEDAERYQVWFVCEPCTGKVLALMEPPPAAPSADPHEACDARR